MLHIKLKVPEFGRCWCLEKDGSLLCIFPTSRYYRCVIESIWFYHNTCSDIRIFQQSPLEIDLMCFSSSVNWGQHLSLVGWWSKLALKTFYRQSGTFVNLFWFDLNSWKFVWVIFVLLDKSIFYPIIHCSLVHNEWMPRTITCLTCVQDLSRF